MKTNLTPQINAETAHKNMEEKTCPYAPHEAIIEAQRCLYCFDAPCIMACPTGIDIPAFIGKISRNHVVGAARTILESNILGRSCARVCPTEVLCEGACVLEDREKNPVKIGRLQQYATDYAHQKNLQLVKPGIEKTGKKVALIGAGPASLSCAAELVKRGHDAVIYEKKNWAGGLNTLGIAYYKMPPQVSLEEVNMIKHMGVDIQTSIEITSTQQLEGYDALFIGIGLGKTHPLGIPGEDLPEVVEAIDFIESFHTHPLHETAVGKNVLVVGGGNTAIDAVVQAKKLGAGSSTLAYRRGEQQMPAYAFEYEWAKQNGCAFIFHAAPIEIIGRECVEGIRLIQTRLTDDGKLETIPGTTFSHACDMVIKASGQTKKTEFLKQLFPGLELSPKGTIIVHPETGATNLPYVYAGGDAANGGTEVVNAVGEGKKAALAIHTLFTQKKASPPIQISRHGTHVKIMVRAYSTLFVSHNI